jgi:hypothetical protein
MTNLEWLAKMPKEEAGKFLDGLCPLRFPSNACMDCPYDNYPENCRYICMGVASLSNWLLAEREVHDGK